MNFTHYKFGSLSRGQIIEVTLQGSAANVRLMKSQDFAHFQHGRRHKYFGGLVKRSPHRFVVPSAGQWHVTVDMAGLRGNVRSAVRVLPGVLPDAMDRPLSSVPSLVREPEIPSPGTKTYDVFISHASEDKEPFVRSLAEAIQGMGLTVWYDELKLKIGDSLRRSIDQGLATSRVGLFVLSPDFIKKGWTNYELDGIVSRTVSGEQIMIPIWHNVTKQQVLDYSPSIADRVARSTATHTVAEIAEKIYELLNPVSDDD